MIYRTDRLSGLNTNWGDTVYNYLSNYIDGLTHVAESTDIDFFGKFTLKLTTGASPVVSVYCDGVSKQIATQYMDVNGYFDFVLLVTDNFVSLRIVRQWGQIITFGWILDENGKYYVGGTGTDSFNYSNCSINKWKFFDVTDGVSNGYDCPNMINFTAPTGTIAVGNIVPLTGGGNLIVYAEGLLSCSTVTVDSVVSLPNSTNYLAIGANVLCPIDSVPTA